jgi:hypothetical protein
MSDKTGYALLKHADGTWSYRVVSGADWCAGDEQFFATYDDIPLAAQDYFKTANF